MGLTVFSTVLAMVATHASRAKVLESPGLWTGPAEVLFSAAAPLLHERTNQATKLVAAALKVNDVRENRLSELKS